MNVTVQIVDGSVRPVTPSAARSGEGALLAFLGLVRRTEDGRAIHGLDYELYEPMARNELTRLCAEAVERFALTSASVIHSRGLVPVGEASLSIHLRAEHRAETLEAMSWLIGALKTDVPIWKKPVFSDGSRNP